MSAPVLTLHNPLLSQIDQIIHWKIRLIEMLRNMLEVNYLGDASDILITL